MAKDDDLFPLSLPIYQSPPHVFDADMTEAVNNGQHEFYNSPDYFFDTKANADFTDFAHGKTTADPSALVAQPSQGSPQDSSGESQRSSLDSSDGSSADAIMEDGGRVTGCIAIPADPSNEPTTDRIRTNTTSFRDDLAMGNDFFDFETAGSSPTQVSRDVTSNPIRMAIRSAPNHGMPPFGYGQFSGVFSVCSICFMPVVGFANNAISTRVPVKALRCPRPQTRIDSCIAVNPRDLSPSIFLALSLKFSPRLQQISKPQRSPYRQRSTNPG